MMRPLTPTDLEAVRGMLPYTALHLLSALGEEAALALLDRLAGQTIKVPKHPDKHPEGARKWAMLEEIVGPAAMKQLAATWGGAPLEIPTCIEARREARDRAIRAAFDRLTMRERMSKAQAIYEIGLTCRPPLTSRQIEKIVDKPDAEERARRQVDLF